MLSQGFVLLSDDDDDAPVVPAVATVSKDDAWDHGGLALGQAAAVSGRLWIDRPYFTGNPEVGWLVGQLNRATTIGGLGQIGNEQNLALEGWTGGRDEWFAFEDAVRAAARHPDRLLAMPPSPGVPGWQSWVRPAGDHAVHAYGSAAEMRAVVAWYLDNTTGRVYVTECNFAAGRSVDRDAWANSELLPFLDWCATEPRVAHLAYFAWRWRNPDSRLPTPVDAAGTAIETVIRDWTPTEEPAMPNPWTGKILTVWNAPHDPKVLTGWAARLALAGVELKTADGSSSWLDSPRRNLSRAYVDELRAAGLRVMGWTYNYCDLVTNGGDRGDGIPEQEAEAAARAVAELGLDGQTWDLEIECEGHGDLVAVMLATARDLMPTTPFGAHTWAYRSGHARYPWAEIGSGVDVVRPMIYRPTWEASDSFAADELGPWYAGKIVCPVWGITEPQATVAALAADQAVADVHECPGVAFWELSGLPGRPGVERWIAALAVGDEPAPEPEPDLEALQTLTWNLLDEVQAVAGDWTAMGWPSTGVGIAAAAESAKTHVRSSKGER